jgi:DNA-binding NarL/FixJ family response regulator
MPVRLGISSGSSLRKELLNTIRIVHAGGRRIHPDVAVGIAEHHGDDALSRREVDVLQLVAAGRADKAPARII